MRCPSSGCSIRRRQGICAVPEGPSIVILRDEAAKFRGKTVRRVSGNSKLELDRMLGRRVVSIRSWGKHFLMEFRGFSLPMQAFCILAIFSRKESVSKQHHMRVRNAV